jgi:hypothetical protein
MGTYPAQLGDLEQSLVGDSQNRATFVEATLTEIRLRPNNFESIIAMNLGRQSVADDEAVELELGPNNCAASAD